TPASQRRPTCSISSNRRIRLCLETGFGCLWFAKRTTDHWGSPSGNPSHPADIMEGGPALTSLAGPTLRRCRLEMPLGKFKERFPVGRHGLVAAAVIMEGQIAAC